MNFIADGMLGGLAKWLRLMGYDTLYFNTHRKTELLSTARKEGRIILTRDRKLCRDNGDIAIFIENDGTHRQLTEAKQKLSLKLNPEMFFTRCPLCNCLLEEKKKDDVISIVPEYVRNNKDKFSQCPGCKRVYWDGDHCKEIRGLLKTLM